MTTKEELEKEAKTYAEEHKMDMIDYHDSLFMEDAYIASAEPREKQLEEKDKKIADLEKENAELKKQQFSLRNERNTFLAQNEQYEKDLIGFNENLTKAKELIKRLMHELVVSNRPYDEVELLVKDLEQFLNSEVENDR